MDSASTSVKLRRLRTGTTKAEKTYNTLVEYIKGTLLKIFFNQYSNNKKFPESLDKYLSDFLKKPDGKDNNIDNNILLKEYIKNFLEQYHRLTNKKLAYNISSLKINTYIYSVHTGFHKIDEHFVKKIVPDNIVLVFLTPINRFGFAETAFTVDFKNRLENIWPKVTNLTRVRTNKNSSYYILKNLLCLDKKTQTNITKKNNKLNTSYKPMFQNALTLLPGQYYYDMKISIKTNDNQNFYIDKNNLRLHSTDTNFFSLLSEELLKISTENKDQINYIFTNGCRALNYEISDENFKMYIDEFFSYSINILLGDCDIKEKESLLKYRYMKTIPHLDNNLNTSIKNSDINDFEKNAIFIKIYTNFEKFFSSLGHSDQDKELITNIISFIMPFNINLYNNFTGKIMFDKNNNLTLDSYLLMIYCFFTGKNIIIPDDEAKELYMFLKTKNYIFGIGDSIEDQLTNIKSSILNYFNTYDDSEKQNIINKINYYKKYPLDHLLKKNTTLKIIYDDLSQIYENYYIGTPYLESIKIINDNEYFANTIMYFLLMPFHICLYLYINYPIDFYELRTEYQFPSINNLVRRMELPRMGRNARRLLLSRTKKYNTSTNT
jgi:hypothetical protein